MILNDGYWRPNNQSTDIYRCNRPDNCFYVEGSDNHCEEGYHGRLCTE